MRPIEEILSDRRHVYSDTVEICDDGMRGYLSIQRVEMTFVASWGGDWDHVSVAPVKRKILPTWEQMCIVKDVFFREDEAVIQIHPPRSEYVNMMTNCLHLWRPISKQLVLPPSFMVGYREGQTRAELEKEIDEYYAALGKEKKNEE